MAEPFCSVDSLEDYTYEPLQPRQIRLFYMLQGSHDNEEIVGELRIVPFPALVGESSSHAESSSYLLQGPCPPYTAVSYAWGPTSSAGSHLTKHIVCN